MEDAKNVDFSGPFFKGFSRSTSKVLLYPMMDPWDDGICANING